MAATQGDQSSMALKSFRELRVWQSGMDLAVRAYRLTRVFPNPELYGLASQIQRAVVSVPCNIAEGYAREHTKEYLNHISIAQGSLAELETQLELAHRLEYVNSEELAEAIGDVHALARQLYALRNSLRPKLGAASALLLSISVLAVLLTRP